MGKRTSSTKSTGSRSRDAWAAARGAMSFLTSTGGRSSRPPEESCGSALGAAPWQRLGDACRSEGGPLFSSHSLSTASSSEARTTVESSKAQSDVYVGPFGGALKRVKILSVSSLVATTSSLPVMVYLQGSAQFSGRIGAVMTVGFFSLFTTSMLHWFSSPYICRSPRRLARRRWKLRPALSWGGRSTGSLRWGTSELRKGPSDRSSPSKWTASLFTWTRST